MILNDGLFLALLFFIGHVTFILAPIGILVAAYLDKGIIFFNIAVGTSIFIISSYFIYEKFIKRTFLITVDHDLYYHLYHQAKKKKTHIKELIHKRIK